LPDRDKITMKVPFMRAYTNLLVQTCHKRGAHAMGGMAAFIPNRKLPEITAQALAKVREDKVLEVNSGFDGTWVAHPDLVPIAKEVFASFLKDKPHQKDKWNKEVYIDAKALLDFTIPDGTITEHGLRVNINVGIRYLASWLDGKGAAALDNLMEDAATAEISRAQVWQWIHNHETFEDGRKISKEFVKKVIDEEMEKIFKMYGADFDKKNLHEAQSLFEKLVFEDSFTEFLTLSAYKKLN